MGCINYSSQYSAPKRKLTVQGLLRLTFCISDHGKILCSFRAVNFLFYHWVYSFWHSCIMDAELQHMNINSMMPKFAYLVRGKYCALSERELSIFTTVNYMIGFHCKLTEGGATW